MPDYSKGKIYSIRFYNNDKLIYIGSTIQSLAKRFGEHKKTLDCSLFQYIQANYNGDFKCCYIELLEYFKCDNKNELNKKEGETIRKFKADDNNIVINKNIAGRDKKQYYHENADKIKEHNKQYYQENTDKINEYNKQYQQENADKIKEQRKEYYQKNTNTIKEYRKQYNQKNADKIKKHKKEYYQENTDKIKEHKKEYYQKNADKIKEQKKEYYQKKKAETEANK